MLVIPLAGKGSVYFYFQSVGDTCNLFHAWRVCYNIQELRARRMVNNYLLTLDSLDRVTTHVFRHITSTILNAQAAKSIMGE